MSSPLHPIRTDDSAPHPLGSRARALLSSVFGPYAQDDRYGSRAINPMELYHNQVTRVQGPFSLRMFHRSWGLMFIQANISAPCTLLDFPSLERFTEEVRSHPYDIVGISSITTNVLKVRKMCEIVRRYLPDATIVVGGHVANLPDIEDQVDADFVVKGEGIRWFRRFLGDDPNQPIRHPVMPARTGTRSFGVSVRERKGAVAATVVPSVGCPIGCNFCATSAMFGGKGKFVDFYQSGDELFDAMCQLEAAMQTQSFFVLDENFLFHRRRALRLLELMQQNDKPWSLYAFSSAKVLRSYEIEQLVALGVSWVWLGLEGEDSTYGKVSGIDTFGLVKELRSHGIRVLGSTIIGLENHSPDTIDRVIDYAVRHDTDFHQFMLYTALPGTPLYAELSRAGLLLDETECPTPDTHGQDKFNYRHPQIENGLETEFLIRAFSRDFEVNGPSIIRSVETILAGWKRYKKHPDPRVRRRIAFDAKGLATAWSAAVAATARFYRDKLSMRAKMKVLLRELHREFGWKSRLSAVFGGPLLLRKIRAEAERLADGWTYEPPTFYEHNEAVEAVRGAEVVTSTPSRHTIPCSPSPQDDPTLCQTAGSEELQGVIDS
jgi:radical SAM superfamily enzyme YgiQ (UPF0313 family)